MVIAGDPSVTLSPRPTGLDALGAGPGPYREGQVADAVAARLRGTGFVRLFEQSPKAGQISVSAGWRRDRDRDQLALQLSVASPMLVAEQLASELSSATEVVLRAVTLHDRCSVVASIEHRYVEGRVVARTDHRDADLLDVRRRLGPTPLVEGVAEWLLEDDSLRLVDLRYFQPRFSARVQRLAERIAAGATATLIDVNGARALRVSDALGAHISVLSASELVELEGWL